MGHAATTYGRGRIVLPKRATSNAPNPSERKIGTHL